MPHVTVYGLASCLGQDFYDALREGIVEAIISIKDLMIGPNDVTVHLSAELGSYQRNSDVVIVVSGLFDKALGITRTPEMKQAMCEAILSAAESALDMLRRELMAEPRYLPRAVEVFNLPFVPAADGFAKNLQL